MEFNVTLSHKDNSDQYKFMVVEDCKDRDELIDHIWETEPDWDIHAIDPVWVDSWLKCPLTGLMVTISNYHSVVQTFHLCNF